MARNTYHTRSTSMPSRSHPLNQKVEENLQRLRVGDSSHSTSYSSSSSTFFSEALSGLADLYASVEDLLQMPLTQQALSHNGQGKWVEQVLGESLRLLDTCGTARDVMLQMKGMVQDLQSALRRRKVGELEMKNKLGAYISSRKNIEKQIERCLKSMNKTEERKSCFSPLADTDEHDLVVVMTTLREASSITISIFRSLLFFLSATKPKTTWRSLGSKWMGSRRVTCYSKAEQMSEVDRMDVLVSVLSSHKCNDAEQVQNAQNHLEGMEESIQGIENRLDQVYRHLIKSRVSLLNILSN